MPRRPVAGLLASLLALLTLVACSSPPRPQQPADAPTPLVVDTDVSWDDVAALAYLLREPRVDVRAVTVSGTGVTHCAPGVTHVRQLVAALGHRPVPVACGRTEPLDGFQVFPTEWRQVADGFYRLALPQVAAPTGPSTAVDALAAAIGSTGRTVVLSLAPLTNVADLLQQRPAVRSRIARIVAMAGALDVPGNEVRYGQAEYNAYIDPRALDVVLRAGVPTTLVPLDASAEVPVDRAFTATLSRYPAVPAAQLLARLLSEPYYYTGAQYLWDPLAAVATVDATVVQTASRRLSVVQSPGAAYGRILTVPDGVPTTVALHADAESFARRYLHTVTGDALASPVAARGAVAVTASPGGWAGQDDGTPGAGLRAVRVDNRGSEPVTVLVLKLSAGHDERSVDAAIRAGVTAVPSWAALELSATVPPGHAATWRLDLAAGTHVVVGAGQTLPVRRLVTLQLA